MPISSEEVIVSVQDPRRTLLPWLWIENLRAKNLPVDLEMGGQPVNPVHHLLDALQQQVNIRKHPFGS